MDLLHHNRMNRYTVLARKETKWSSSILQSVHFAIGMIHYLQCLIIQHMDVQWWQKMKKRLKLNIPTKCWQQLLYRHALVTRKLIFSNSLPFRTKIITLYCKWMKVHHMCTQTHTHTIQKSLYEKAWLKQHD